MRLADDVAALRRPDIAAVERGGIVVEEKQRAIAQGRAPLPPGHQPALTVRQAAPRAQVPVDEDGVSASTDGVARCRGDALTERNELGRASCRERGGKYV